MIRSKNYHVNKSNHTMLTMVRPAAVGVAASWGGVVVTLAVSSGTWHGGGGWYKFEVMMI